MSRASILACALLAAPAAFADAPHHASTHVDFYYVPDSNFEVTVSDPSFGSVSGDIDGDGFGARALIGTGSLLGLVGEFQRVTYEEDGDEGDIDRVRLALGGFGPSTSGVYLGYDKLEISDDSSSFEMDGLTVHARLAGDVAPRLQLYADAGWTWMTDDDDDDWDGPEVSAGAAVGLSDAFALFADYRYTQLECTPQGTNATLEFEFKDLRVGGRFTFGG